MLKVTIAALNKVAPVVASLDTIAPFRNSGITPAQDYPALLKFNIDNFDNATILQSVNQAMDIHGQWNYRIGETQGGIRVDNGYGGIGLTYNPNHVDGTEIDIHQQVQGNHKPGARGLDGKNPFTVLSDSEKRTHAKKNTHYDTYSMCYRTPASRHGHLGNFLNTFKRTMVRSAVRIIYADQIGQVGDDQLAGVRWHRDEPFFENLRINIPLLTSPLFVLEQEGHEPYHLEAGYAYTWDTNTLHRAYATARSDVPMQRIHLMLGFSCWWDFDEATGTWSQNEFFNQKHPLDMLVDGDVIPGLQLTQ
jgi:hypothetical protein